MILKGSAILIVLNWPPITTAALIRCEIKKKKYIYI